MFLIGKVPEKLRKKSEKNNFDLFGHPAPPSGVLSELQPQNRLFLILENTSFGSIYPKTDKKPIFSVF